MTEAKNASAAITGLCVMMFVQFFIWGAWYVTAPNYLGTIGFGPNDFGWTYSVGPIAGMISPFFVGMVADRFFPAQRVLGLLHILGGVIMLLATSLMTVDSPSPGLINWVFFGYMLTFYPTLALTNTLAMKNLAEPDKQFPLIRVFGTGGWIAAGFLLTFLEWDTAINMFYLVAGAAIFLGIFSFFFLPHTPPEAQGKISAREILGLDALVLLKDRNYLIFMISSVLICIPLAFYYQLASRVVEMVELPIGQTMTYGQISEVFFMLVMPLFFRRLGVKWMLAVGMACWVIRYLLFAFGAPDQTVWMILIGIIIHGICYDFFFVTGQIYTDQRAPKHIRAQAQGMLVLFTLGLGMAIGAQLAGMVEAHHTTQEAKDFAAVVEAKGKEIKSAEEALAKAEGDAKKELEATIKTLKGEKNEARLSELRALEWTGIWLKPALFAAAVMVMFLIFFRNPPPRAPEGA